MEEKRGSEAVVWLGAFLIMAILFAFVVYLPQMQSCASQNNDETLRIVLCLAKSLK